MTDLPPITKIIIQVRVEGQLKPVPFLVLLDGEPVPMEPPKIEQVEGSRRNHLLPPYEHQLVVPQGADQVFLDVIEEIPFTDTLRRTLWRVR